MANPHEFLIVDDHNDNRFLLTKTILRKFPNALIQECQQSDVAITAATRGNLSAAIVHRSADMSGLELVSALRRVAPKLPLLYVSGTDHRADGFNAGATAFLHYDAWLRVGTVVEEMLRTDLQNPEGDPTAVPAVS